VHTEFPNSTRPGPDTGGAPPPLSAPLSSQMEQKGLSPAAVVNVLERLREKRGYMASDSLSSSGFGEDGLQGQRGDSPLSRVLEIVPSPLRVQLLPVLPMVALQ